MLSNLWAVLKLGLGLQCCDEVAAEASQRTSTVEEEVTEQQVCCLRSLAFGRSYVFGVMWSGLVLCAVFCWVHVAACMGKCLS